MTSGARSSGNGRTVSFPGTTGRRAAGASIFTLMAAACSGQISAVGSSGGGTAGKSTGPAQTPGVAGGGSAGQGGVVGMPSNPCVPGMITVGVAPLQRLTRDQYANSIRDLLGLSSVSTTDITPDERFGPFAANVSVGITDLDVDHYEASAETVAKSALAIAKWDTLVPCDHTATGDGGCADQFIKVFGQRAYRRPLTDTEVSRYTAQYEQFATGGYDNGIRVVVQTMLQSPNFLYRPELGVAPGSNSGPMLLTPYETATRLSYFLWNSTPDNQLLAAASAAKLASEGDLTAQAQRMLADARARSTIASFHTQWLDVTTAPTVTKDATAYPAFSSTTAAAMAEETGDFADYVIRKGDATLSTILTAPFTIAPDALLPLYGAARAAGDTATSPLSLNPAQRAGVLTQIAFLAVHAHPNQSGLVQRGKYIRENVICEPVPDPPPNVNATPPSPSPNATARQRFAAHESLASCAACHTLIDNIGFGLENFDGSGAYQTMDGNQPIDARGKFVGTQDLDGSFVGAVEMAKKLAASSEVHTCVVRQWMTYALGRSETTDDACSLNQLVTSFNTSGQNIKQLMIDIVATDSFRYLRVN